MNSDAPSNRAASELQRRTGPSPIASEAPAPGQARVGGVPSSIVFVRESADGPGLAVADATNARVTFIPLSGCFDDEPRACEPRIADLPAAPVSLASHPRRDSLAIAVESTPAKVIELRALRTVREVQMPDTSCLPDACHLAIDAAIPQQDLLYVATGGAGDRYSLSVFSYDVDGMVRHAESIDLGAVPRSLAVMQEVENRLYVCTDDGIKKFMWEDVQTRRRGDDIRLPSIRLPTTTVTRTLALRPQRPIAGGSTECRDVRVGSRTRLYGLDARGVWANTGSAEALFVETDADERALAIDVAQRKIFVLLHRESSDSQRLVVFEDINRVHQTTLFSPIACGVPTVSAHGFAVDESGDAAYVIDSAGVVERVHLASAAAPSGCE